MHGRAHTAERAMAETMLGSAADAHTYCINDYSKRTAGDTHGKEDNMVIRDGNISGSISIEDIPVKTRNLNSLNITETIIVSAL
jgi:hypothetical protein